MDRSPISPRASSATSRRFRCEQCSKAYSKLEHLTRHQRTHSQSRPFRCAHCGKSFGRQDVLNRHSRIHTNHTSKDLPSQKDSVQTAEDANQAQPTPSTAISTDPFFSGSRPTELLHPGNTETPQETEDLLSWLLLDRHDSITLPLVDFLEPWDNLNTLPTYEGTSTQNDPTPGQEVGRTAMPQMYSLIEELSRRLSSDFHSEGITSSFLDACLHEFFARFLPCFPVIHEPTFSSTKCIPPLLLNMVALGSLFLCLPRARQKGEMLWRLGHTVVATSWQTLIGVRGPRDERDGIQLVLTALLGQTYALLSSNTSIRSTAFVFHGLGFYWARIRGMYSINEIPPDQLPTLNAFASEKNAAWESWAAAEVQRRAILGHYILDGLIAQASGSPPSARHLINRLGSACSDALFAAKTADDWVLEIHESRHPKQSFAEILGCIISSTQNQLPIQLSRFSISVVLEGLQSLTSELHESGGPSVGVVSRRQILQGLVNLHHGGLKDDILLAIRWHAICLDLSTPSTILFNAICKGFNIPQLLGGVSGEGLPRSWNLHRWTKSANAGRALLHAIAINQLLSKVTLGSTNAIHFPSAIFSSTVTLCAFGAFNKNTFKIPMVSQWQHVWASELEESSRWDISDNDQSSEDVWNYFDSVSAKTPTLATVNILSEVNFLQMCLKTVGSTWGVCEQMETMASRMVLLLQDHHASPV